MGKIEKPFRDYRRAFKVNDPESVQALEKLASEDKLDQYRGLGLISGEFKAKGEGKLLASKKAAQADASAQKQAAAEEARRQKPETGKEPRPATELPAGMPGRLQLIKAKFDTVEKVQNASDEELAAIDGIGEATVEKIREALK